MVSERVTGCARGAIWIDSIKTECTYSAPASFGKGTNEEMCYWFALAYPAVALADGGFFGGLAHGANACLGR